MAVEGVAKSGLGRFIDHERAEHFDDLVPGVGEVTLLKDRLVVKALVDEVELDVIVAVGEALVNMR